MTVDFVDLAERLGIVGHTNGQELYAQCPLHSDDSPSFSMKAETGEWTCWAGCGPEKGRSFARLVQLVLGLGYLEAVRWVSRNGRHEDAQRLTEELQAVFETPVENPEPASTSAEYVDRLDMNVLPRYWFERGFSWDDAEFWGARFDGIRQALVIPVYDGPEAVGYVQRNLTREPKYLNAKGVEKLAFGVWHCLPMAPVVVVEGPLDAIWVYKAGYNAVALFGTNISDAQVKQLATLPASEIVLALDNDEAGIKALPKVASRLTAREFALHNVSVVSWREKDAQECDLIDVRSAIESRKRWLEMEMTNAGT